MIKLFVLPHISAIHKSQIILNKTQWFSPVTFHVLYALQDVDQEGVHILVGRPAVGGSGNIQAKRVFPG